MAQGIRLAATMMKTFGVLASCALLFVTQESHEAGRNERENTISVPWSFVQIAGQATSQGLDQTVCIRGI